MSTRFERRREKARIKKKLRNPLVRRILKAEIEAGGVGTEIYRLDDDRSGRPMYFNISALRAWTEANCEIFAMPADFDRATQLIESGAVEADYVCDHTIRTEPKPIIVCRGLLGGDHIVDGAHRFVAFCMGVAQFGLKDAGFPGHVLEPDEWRPFVIPESVARACGVK